MYILIYLLGYIIAFICFRKIQKINCFPQDWKEVIRALAVALLSWGTVLFAIVYAIIILCRLIEEWYEDNKNKFGKPPKWL